MAGLGVCARMRNLAEKLRNSKWLPGLGLAVLALLVYANSFPGVFIQDDHWIVARNPLVEQFDLFSIFRHDYWAPLSNSGLYRPVTILSLALNRMLFGAAPYGFHLINVVLHACAAVFLCVLLRTWGFRLRTAFLAAALFAVHPIHTEVVNQAVGRSELLVAVFLLLALRFANSDGIRNYLAAGSCFVLALLSKEHAVVFVGLLPLVDAFRAQSLSVWRRRWARYAGFAAIVVIWLGWRAWGVVSLGAPEVYDPVYVPLAYVTWLERFLTALKLQWLYLGKLFVPWSLQASYAGAEFPGVLKLATPLTWLLLAGTSCALYAVQKGLRKACSWALFAVLLGVSFLPTSNLLFPIGVTFAERLAYFPSLWFCAGIAVLITLQPGVRFPQRLSVPVAVIILLMFASATIMRNRDFASEIALWQSDVERAPQNPLAWQALGESLTEKGRYDAAESAFRKAIELAPESATSLHVWAVFLLKTGRYDEAIQAAEKSRRLQLARNDLARAAGNRDVIIEALIEKGAFRKALVWLEQDPASPDQPVARVDLRGRVLAGLGRCSEAIADFERIPVWQMKRGVRLGYSRCLYEADRLVEVERLLEPLLHEPDNAAIWNFLGVVRAGLKRPEEALAAFRRAVSLQPQNRYYRENFERMLTEVGSVDVER